MDGDEVGGDEAGTGVVEVDEVVLPPRRSDGSLWKVLVVLIVAVSRHINDRCARDVRPCASVEARRISLVLV